MPKAYNVNPIMIKWAREDAGYELSDLPLSLKDAEKWENGEKIPTWDDLRKLAKKYKRPSFFYFLQKPPKEDNGFVEYRSDEISDIQSPSLRLEIRKAKFRRNVFIHINDDMHINIPNFTQHILKSDDEYELANHIRNFLNIDFETQNEWLIKDNNILNHLKEVCFELGILVFEMEGVSESEVCGCSLFYNFCPIILVNGKNTPNKSIFTLIHELVHLIQGVSAICDVNRNNIKEAFCNKVASEVLKPFESIKNDNGETTNLNGGYSSNIGGVSKQALSYKLKKEFIFETDEKRRFDKIENDEKNKNFLLQSHPKIKKIKCCGEPYIKFIIRAYENKIITVHKAVKFLDCSFDNFEYIMDCMECNLGNFTYLSQNFSFQKSE